MQQGGAAGAGSQSQPQYCGVTQMLPTAADQSQLVEAASPISSRPPAHNLDEFIQDDDALAAGGSGGGGSGGNRWPRQETLALLEIRSDMDAAFRDATLKGPLWEDVSRKLAELGYKRSAKKCKEKFENLHKYYKRTKEGRAGRQDGKNYRFFTQLEALHSSTAAAGPSVTMPQTPIPSAAATATNFVPIGIGVSNPMPISNVRIGGAPAPPPPSTIGMASIFTSPTPSSAPLPTGSPAGISFSSDGPSSSSGSDDDDEDDEETEESSRKRKRSSSSSRGSSTTRRMMEFFENLMKRVMQKQEAMQQRFLEAIEKREQDRMIREEAWKRQEMARLTREHELMAQERAISAQRDAAIISFLQKITGQTIQLPQHVNIPVSTQPPPPPPPQQPVVTTVPPPTHQHQSLQHYPPQPQPQHQQQSQSTEIAKHQLPLSSDVVMAVPEQQVPPQDPSSGGGGGGTFEASSSRWPKQEVLALISLRSGLESRYQEAGPKGPLWEEISAEMARSGYKRSAKRCKEKWENINKYYKKVKESNKKRPEDAKTCPYFHQLDALYRKKMIGNTSGGAGSSSGGGIISQNAQEQVQQQHEVTKLDSIPATKPQDAPPIGQVTPQAPATESENKNGSSAEVQASNIGSPGNLFGEETGGASKKPEDTVKKFRENHQLQQQQLTVDDYDKMDEHDSDNMDEEESEDEDEVVDEELEEERKLAYKVELQRQSTQGPPNGGGNGAASFLAMVQ